MVSAFIRLLREGKLRDSRDYRGRFPSWPADAGQLGIPIDHALVNHNLEVLDRQVIEGLDHSDHRPITVTVR